MYCCCFCCDDVFVDVDVGFGDGVLIGDGYVFCGDGFVFCCDGGCCGGVDFCGDGDGDDLYLYCCCCFLFFCLYFW